MSWLKFAATVGLCVSLAAQTVLAIGICLSSSWRVPTDHAPTWELAGQLILPPLTTDWHVTGEWGVPRWTGLGAKASGSGLTVGWSSVWDTVGPDLRYAQAEVEWVSGGIVGRWVWAWADPAGTGQLDFGAWARVGWPDNYPAGWSLTAELGATAERLALLGPGRSYTVEFHPIGGQALLLHEAILSAWWHRWKADAVFSPPGGLEEVRLSGQVRAGILTVSAEHVATPTGNTLSVQPSLCLGAGGLVIHSEVTWEPPLLITGFRVLGLTLECPAGKAWVELTIDLGDHSLVAAPHVSRLSIRVPVSEGTSFSITSWTGGPDTLWGWAKSSLALRATASRALSLYTGLEVSPAGLLAWEAGFTFCLGGTH